MTVLPFRWQGATRSEQLRSLLLARSQEWLRTWGMPNAGLECTLDGLEALDPSWCWMQIQGDSGAVLTLGISGDGFEQVGCRLMDTPTPDRVQLASGIGKRAVMDLCRGFVGAEVANPQLVEIAQPEPDSLNTSRGIASFAWTLVDVHLALFLSADLCTALVPTTPATREPLHRRQVAILPEVISMEAVLDLGNAELERTVDLRPGDVIKTSIPLDAMVQIRTKTGSVVMVGHLVSSEGRRGIRYLTAPQN